MSKDHENYILQPSPIGSGGQAEVFVARHRNTGEIVAFKRVLKELQYNEEAMARMRREIDVQTSVKHLNVMPVLDYSKTYHWYTMPLAKQVVSRLSIPVDETTLFEIVEHCATGLKSAHEANYVHRDLTPSNILQIDEGGELRWVVADWGLVRPYGKTTVVRTVQNQEYGTLGYAAPELYSDAHQADPRADVYSLGRVVVWCLTGRRLLPNMPSIPDGKWSEFVRTTTALNVSERPQNMEEVLQWVENIKNATLLGVEISSNVLSIKDVRPTGRKLKAFTINGKRVISTSWSDLLKQTLNTIASREVEFVKVLNLKDIGVREPFFDIDPGELARPYKVDGTNVYVESKMGSHEVANLLVATLILFSYSDGFVTVELRDERRV
jgi:serine/threonine protein kinase